MTDARNNTPIHNRESGVALVAVLWTVILLAVLATALIAIFRSNARILSTQVSRLQAMEAARAGISLALVELSDPQRDWRDGQAPRTYRIGDAQVEVTIMPESGKVDLNTGDPDLLRGLLTADGVGPGAADKIADDITARRFVGGAGPFESIGELARVPEISRDSYKRLVPNLTLYSRSSTVDPSFASDEVIRAMPGITEADVEAREHSRSGFGPYQSGPNDLSRVVGHSFSISAVARLADHTSARHTEVVQFTGNPREPVWVLATE